MKGVELYARVRFAVQIEGVSRREAARRFGLDPRTVAKMLAFSVPPGYRRSRPPARPKLDPFTGIIDAILAADEGRPKKQRHTAKRIFERLRDEHGYAGGITIVKDYVRVRRRRHREVFVPLRHDPGHAQVDFGEALAEIAGVEGKIHFFAMDLPHSDACFVQAYPAETAEAFCDGHNAAFSFFGKVPVSILYDNTTLAVARILGDGVRQRTRVFSELQSHYVFADRFGRPGKGNDKGKVEGLIGWVRRNQLVPVPRAASLAALNEQLLELIERERQMIERRIKEARFPTVKSLDSFDFTAIPSLNKTLVLELARCEYIARRENVIAVGNSGTGKSHIALGLGLAACQKGLSVGFITAAAMVHELIEARDEKRLLRLQRQLAAYKLLIIDELGYVPLSTTGAELLFEVFSQRYERGSTIVTSNLPFDEWTGLFGRTLGGSLCRSGRRGCSSRHLSDPHHSLAEFRRANLEGHTPNCPPLPVAIPRLGIVLCAP